MGKIEEVSPEDVWVKKTRFFSFMEDFHPFHTICVFFFEKLDIEEMDKYYSK